MSGVLRVNPAQTSFPQIADYGFLSDCETCALIAPSGSVEWLCLPRFDSPSVFGAILDRDAGIFRLGPDGVSVPSARRYLPGTMVLETSWGARSGWIIIRDVLLIGPCLSEMVDLEILAAHARGIVIYLDNNGCDTARARATLHSLAELRAPILGAVVADMP